ncbi:MAG: LpxI family protein [Halocynthiibacter sp.]
MTSSSPSDVTAILAGGGQLPLVVARHLSHPFLVDFEGVDCDGFSAEYTANFNTLGALFDVLRARKVTHVVFAGGMARPALNPAEFDSKMISLAPRLMAAFQSGDDALLRLVVDVFEEEGFTILGAHDLVPELVAKASSIAGPVADAPAHADAETGAHILEHMSALDIGQSCVVANGLCLGLETLQGTDAMLGFVAMTPPHLRRAKGVLIKRAKTGQDLRVDMPAIGVATVENAAKAGLSGIAIEAKRVLLIDRPAICAAAERLNISLWAF